MTFLPSNTLQVPLDENVSFSIDPIQFNEQITRRYRDIAREVNNKERAIYPLATEILNSQKFFNIEKELLCSRGLRATHPLHRANSAPFVKSKTQLATGTIFT